MARAREEASLDDVFEHGRAIFEHPLRTAYPYLLGHGREGAPVEAAHFRHEELAYGIGVAGDVRELFVDDQFGSRLLSAALDEEGRIEPWSLRVLSLLPHEFLTLDLAAIDSARTIFHSRYFQAATKLREAPLAAELSAPLQAGIRQLAALPLFLAAVSVNGCGPEGIVDLAPDLAYQACCDEHDLCYARGGTEADRARCDEALARCIEAIGGGGLTPGGFTAGFVATVYWLFVTVFGPAASATALVRAARPTLARSRPARAAAGPARTPSASATSRSGVRRAAARTSSPR